MEQLISQRLEDDEKRVLELKAELAEQEREMITAMTTMSGEELLQEESEPAIPSRERLRARQTEDEEEDEVENGHVDVDADDDDNNIGKSRDVGKDEQSH